MRLTAMRILRNDEDADDALQDAALALWQHAASLEKADNPTAYALHTVRNICISRLRSLKPDSPISEAVTISDDTFSPDSADCDEYLEALLQRLPPAQRSVMRLRVYERLDTAAIAETTGQTDSNVRQLLSRARKALRKLYERNPI